MGRFRDALGAPGLGAIAEVKRRSPSAGDLRPDADPARLGAHRAFVVHGAGGIDELSPVGPNLVCEVVDGEVREREIDPEAELGVARCSVEELRGGSPTENAAAIRNVFAGAGGGARSAILLNAAGAIAAGGHAEDLREGLELARETIDSGAAAERLEQLVAFTQAEVVA